MYLGKSMLGVLDSPGHSYLHVSSVSVDFIKSRVGFRPVDSVGFLVSLLQDGSSRKEVIFSS